MTLSNTVAFFGMRVIQFYADKDMEEVLEINKKLKFILYIILCMTGPVIGILICGIICSKIGGYASKNGMIFILFLNIIACIASLLITATLNPFFIFRGMLAIFILLCRCYPFARRCYYFFFTKKFKR